MCAHASRVQPALSRLGYPWAAWDIVAEVSAAEGVPLDIPIGTMLELPRAALTADRIAEIATSGPSAPTT